MCPHQRLSIPVHRVGVKESIPTSCKFSSKERSGQSYLLEASLRYAGLSPAHTNKPRVFPRISSLVTQNLIQKTHLLGRACITPLAANRSASRTYPRGLIGSEQAEAHMSNYEAIFEPSAKPAEPLTSQGLLMD